MVSSHRFQQVPAGRWISRFVHASLFRQTNYIGSRFLLRWQRQERLLRMSSECLSHRRMTLVVNFSFHRFVWSRTDHSQQKSLSEFSFAIIPIFCWRRVSLTLLVNFAHLSWGYPIVSLSPVYTISQIHANPSCWSIDSKSSFLNVSEPNRCEFTQSLLGTTECVVNWTRLPATSDITRHRQWSPRCSCPPTDNVSIHFSTKIPINW